MDSDYEEELVVCFIVLAATYILLFDRNVRRFKTRRINRRRKTIGFYHVYFTQMKLYDSQQFFKYTHMDETTFNKLLTMVRPKLVTMRQLPDSICMEERLAVTLHFLSQGGSMQSIAWTYQMSKTTVHKIVTETCKVLWDVLSNQYLKPPQSEDEWKAVANGFYQEWNFPNCIGALDGKHISIEAPANSGSQYFNYKKGFSIVLLATCDANYFFKLIDVGGYGSSSDGGLFRECTFGQLLDRGSLRVPPPQVLPGTAQKFPFVLVADEAFPLKPYIMRPFPGRNLTASQRIFNYRLSRCRRIIENTFGIIVCRWRLLKTSINASVENVEFFVKAIICLHNYVKYENGSAGVNAYCPPGFVDTDSTRGTWRDEVEPLTSVGRIAGNRASDDSYVLRNQLKDYFMAEGRIEWQEQVLNEGQYPDT